MKTPFFILLFVAGAFTAHAQNCTFTHDPFYQHELWFGGGQIQSNGSLRSLTYGPWRGPCITQWSPDGTALANKYIEHMSGQNTMETNHFARTSDEGSVTSGVFYHGNGYNSYANMYGARFDANGSPVWARYYMLDSIFHVDSYCRIAQAADGGFLLLAETGLGLSLSKLDANGVPTWTKRFWLGVIRLPYDQSKFSGYVIPEANGEITLFAAKGNIYGANNTAVFYMLRLDAQGNVLWKKNFNSTIGNGVELANGDYLCQGTSGSPNFTYYMTRLDHQGNVLWYRTGGSGGNVMERADGHLLLTASDYLITYLSERDANGVDIQRWSAPMEEWPEYTPSFRFLGNGSTRGDSLVMGLTGFYAGPIAPSVLISTGTSDLDCFGFTPSALVSSTTATPPAEITDDTLNIIVDTLKTWTMLIGPLHDANAFDPSAGGAWGAATPGYDHLVYGEIANNSDASTGPITATFTFPSILSYVGANPAPSNVSGQTITWQLPALPPHSQQLVNATLHTPPDPGLLGTSLPYVFSFTQDSTDVNLANNTYAFTGYIFGSYDPNDKTVSPKDQYDIDGDSTLEYTIRFQNTGNGPALRVVLRDTLPSAVDVRTFKLLASSHPCTYTITGSGILEFTFSNINLPDSGSNEVASHGLVTFSLMPTGPLTLGQEITNRADIFFDFNPPIRTNDATVIVSNETKVNDHTAGDHLVVFPVPADHILSALLPSGFKPVTAFATSMDGRRIPIPMLGATMVKCDLDVRHIAPGMYIITLEAQNGRRLSTRFTKK